MTKHYQDYIWRNGLPYGIREVETPTAGITYKMVSDPYHKRNSIELYTDGKYSKTLYDSAIFDFRHLKPALQNAWEKSTVIEEKDRVVSHIRDQDDRLILIEEYKFEGDRCRSCKASSPLGIPVSEQRIHYTALGDTFNGVTLFDSNSHPVLIKKYALDPDSNEFKDLIEENWTVK